MSEQNVLPSWVDNAQAWSGLVRESKIQSRVQVTDQAILNAIGPGQAKKALDLGCGEGWLCREMSSLAWDCVGVDGVFELIQLAQAAGTERYLHLSYENLQDALDPESFDLIVANFSLLGENSVEAAIAASAKLLNSTGRLIIQTLHPGAFPELTESAWQTEDWKSMGDLKLASSPWYFRTREDWLSLFQANCFEPVLILEPAVEGARQASSLLFVLQALTKG